MSVRVRAAQNNVSTTWPKVRKMHLKLNKSASNNASPRGRPDTATLEKPVILDPFYVRRVDMTRLTRERLMTIENLIASPKKQTPSPRSVKETKGHKEVKKEKHKSTKDKISDDSFNEEEKCIVNERKFRKISRVLNTTFRVRSCKTKSLKEDLLPSPTHLQVPTIRTPSAEIVKINNFKNNVRSPVARSKKPMEDLFGSAVGQVVPPPCCTCGREQLPERLHAHPKRQQIKKSKSKDNQENKEVVQQQQQKNSVTKPVPMKFQSGKSRAKQQMGNGTTETDKDTATITSSSKSPDKPSVNIIRRETFKVERNDRDVHEKKSVISPSRKPSPAANSNKKTTPLSLPTKEEEVSAHTVTVVHNKRITPLSLPTKEEETSAHTVTVVHNKRITPLSLPTKEEETSAHTVTVVHNKRITPLSPPTKEEEVSAQTVTVVHSASPRRPRTIICYICSKQFGTASFHLHEPQCIQRWQRENSELPAHLRIPLPQKPDVPVTAEQWNQYAWEATQAALVPCDKCGRTFLPTRIEAHQRVCQQITKKPQTASKQDDESDRENRSCGPTTVHCHICGRMFTRASIGIHENHCLKRWNEEHAKTSPSVETETGQIDYVQTEEAAWKCHLTQLVPCCKCGRKFNPDRVGVHEKCCKGLAKN